MLWALLFSIIFSAGEQTALLSPNSKKYIKGNIEAKDTRADAMSILKNYLKTDHKAFVRHTKTRAKELKLQYADRSVGNDDLMKHYRSFEVELAALQLKAIHGREDILKLINEEEWIEILKQIDGEILKWDDMEAKTRQRFSDEASEVQDIILAYVDSSAGRDSLLVTFRQFVQQREILFQVSHNSTYHSHAILRNKESTKGQVATVYKVINDQRNQTFQSYLDLREALIRNTDEESWKAVYKKAARLY